MHNYDEDMVTIIRHINNEDNFGKSSYPDLKYANIYIRVYPITRPNCIVISNISVRNHRNGYTTMLVDMLKRYGHEIMFECTHNTILSAWLMRNGFECIDTVNQHYMWKPNSSIH